MVDKTWDWSRVNWANFEETVREIGDEIAANEAVINRLAEDDNIPYDVWEAISNISSILVGLHHVVQMHHHLVVEERSGS